MNPMKLGIAIAVVVGTVGAARVEAAPAWDSRGWVMLGEREVHGHGKLERDRIDVGRLDGKFSKITIVVENSDLELVDFNVSFGRGEPWHPALTHFFKEGQRARVIDLPESAWGSDGRSITAIDFAYRNVPGEGHAKVQVWAWRTEAVVPAPPLAPAWDSRGWVLLGEREVHGHGKLERDRIDVGRQDGKFSKITIVVENSDLELVELAVKFGRGEPWNPAATHFFREGQRTRVIDLPENTWSNGRAINAIEFAYRNVPGEGHAKVQVWAWRTEQAGVVAPVRSWDPSGWVMLGERTVDGHRRADHDRIEVGRGEGKFSKLTIVVLDADLEMIDMNVQLRHGEPWHPALSHFFKEGQRTHVIDLPDSQFGGEGRSIKAIDFTYRNLPGEGKAKVQVWALPN